MSQFKSIRRVGGIIALATFAFAFSALAAPQLALDAPSVDFGEVAVNAALVREVRVGNAGNAPLRVSRVKACCGAKASLADVLWGHTPEKCTRAWVVSPTVSQNSRREV